MNQPEIINEVELLRRYQAQKTWTDAQLATSMTAAGWTWGEVQIAGLFAGTLKPSEEQREYIKRYLLNRYYVETLS